MRNFSWLAYYITQIYWLFYLHTAGKAKLAISILFVEEYFLHATIIISSRRLFESMSEAFVIECNTANLLQLSKICLNPQLKYSSIECFDANFSELICDLTGSFCIFHSIFGGLGNLFTLIAVPWATHKRK